jgi:tRNA-splicing ligase RtcB
MRLEKIAPYTYRIPKQGKMRVDAVFFASEEILYPFMLMPSS